MIHPYVYADSRNTSAEMSTICPACGARGQKFQSSLPKADWQLLNFLHCWRLTVSMLQRCSPLVPPPPFLSRTVLDVEPAHVLEVIL